MHMGKGHGKEGSMDGAACLHTYLAQLQPHGEEPFSRVGINGSAYKKAAKARSEQGETGIPHVPEVFG